jgi:hypothetical protein
MTGLVVQPAQPVVAVSLERAHAEFLGQGEGLLLRATRLVVLAIVKDFHLNLRGNF